MSNDPGPSNASDLNTEIFIKEEVFDIDQSDEVAVSGNNEENRESPQESNAFENREEFPQDGDFENATLDPLFVPGNEFGGDFEIKSSGRSIWSAFGILSRISFKKKRMLMKNIEKKPMNYFSLLFNAEFLSTICNETNKRAEKWSGFYKVRKENVSPWETLTVDELRVFLGLLFHTGTIQLESITDYWNNNRLFNIPIFSQQMNKDRFYTIFVFLCLSNEGSDDTELRFHKTIDRFNNIMDKYYYPGKDLCIDENMIFHGGLLTYRQFDDSEPLLKYDLHTLSEPDGTVLRCMLYHTHTKSIPSMRAQYIVVKLLSEKLGHGHSVYIHEFYTSYSLAKKLLKENTYMTGIVKDHTDGIPYYVLQPRTKGIQHVAAFKDGVHVGVWNTRKSTVYLTTEFDNRMVTVEDKRGRTCSKPEPLFRYIGTMHGADRHEEIFTCYPRKNSSHSTEQTIVLHLLQLLLLNSYKLYVRYSRENISFCDYRLLIINRLLPTETL